MTATLVVILIVYAIQGILAYQMYRKTGIIRNMDILMACMAPLTLIQLFVVNTASYFIDLDKVITSKD